MPWAARESDGTTTTNTSSLLSVGKEHMRGRAATPSTASQDRRTGTRIDEPMVERAINLPHNGFRRQTRRHKTRSLSVGQQSAHWHDQVTRIPNRRFSGGCYPDSFASLQHHTYRVIRPSRH